MRKHFSFKDFEDICVVDRCEVDHFISNMVFISHCPDVKFNSFQSLGSCLSYIESSSLEKRIILIEIELGEEEVFLFLARLRLRNIPHTKVILLANRQKIAEMIRIQDFKEVVAYVRKPFSLYTASMLEDGYA